MNRAFLLFKELVKPLYLYVKKAMFVTKYRSLNKHNSTFPVNEFHLSNVIIGKKTYGNIKVIDYDNFGAKLHIGNYCSIAEEVVFLLNGEHNFRLFSSFPFYDENKANLKKAKGDIVIEDDVWIGYRSIILSGVIIGQGSVIAAGSIVSKDIPPYSIYVKDKIYKKRFNEEIIDKLKTLDFSLIDEKQILNDDIFIQPLNEANIDLLILKLKSKENK